jgi:hypothetical protein
MAVAFCLVFFAGYFTHSLFESNSTANEQLARKHDATYQESHTHASIGKVAASSSSASAGNQKMDAQPASKTVSTLNSTLPQTSAVRANAFVENASEANSPKGISDEEIDKLLPEPFNNQLKHIHGGLRENYKNFADSNAPGDWDIDMKNKLSAAIYSNPNSNYIKLDSLDCRANLCEIRVYELKPNVWTNIQSGMALESWWAFGAAHATGFDTASGAGVYVLLVRR